MRFQFTIQTHKVNEIVQEIQSETINKLLTKLQRFFNGTDSRRFLADQ